MVSVALDRPQRVGDISHALLAVGYAYIIINGKKLLSLKPVVRTRRSYKTAGLIKQQKSFQRLAMYGHEVFDVLTKASKVFREPLFE
jgi:hypothetical protein